MSLAVSNTYTLLVHVLVHTCTLMETFHYYYCLHHDCVFRLRSVYCIMSTAMCSIKGEMLIICAQPNTHTYIHKNTCYRFNYLTSVLTDIDLCGTLGEGDLTLISPHQHYLSSPSVSFWCHIHWALGKKKEESLQICSWLLVSTGIVSIWLMYCT